MLHIKTRYEWEDYIDDIYVVYRPWHTLDNRFEVKLPQDKVMGHEVDMQHWIATNFNYDIQCIVDDQRRDLTDIEMTNLRTNVTKRHSTTTVRKWGIKREVPIDPEELEKYIQGAITMAKRYTVDTFYSFYFLSDEDAVAFKLMWA